MDYDLTWLEEMTGLTKADRQKLENYRAKMSEQEKIELMKLQTDLYLQHKGAHFDPDHKATYSYGCLLLATKKMQRLDPALRSNRFLAAMTPEERKIHYKRQLERVKEASLQKTAPKKSWLINHYDELEEMRRAGFSWRQLASVVRSRRDWRFEKLNQVYLREVMTEERKRRDQQKKLTERVDNDEQKS